MAPCVSLLASHLAGMSTLTEEQSIYAKVASEAHAHFSEVIHLTSTCSPQPAFNPRYAALSLRIAIEAMAFAAIAPNKSDYERVRNGKFATDWHAERIFSALEKLNKDFFPLALTSPAKSNDSVFQYGRHSPEPFTRKDASAAYDHVSEALHATNPWSDTIANVDVRWLSRIAGNGLMLLNLHAAFIRADNFTGCWVVSRQANGDWRFLTAKANGEFSTDR